MRERAAEILHVRLGFGTGAARVEALRGVSLSIGAGGLTLITGPSGSGKTSLLSVLGGMVRVDAGSVSVCGHDLSTTDGEGLADFRRRCVGFIFQSFRLIGSLSAAANVELSLDIRSRLSRTERRARALLALERVDMLAKAEALAGALSGGEKQRVAIARAVAHDPPLILADEPTSSLDADNGRRTMRLLSEIVRSDRRTVVVVSHDERTHAFADAILRIEDGQLSAERNLTA